MDTFPPFHLFTRSPAHLFRRGLHLPFRRLWNLVIPRTCHFCNIPLPEDSSPFHDQNAEIAEPDVDFTGVEPEFSASEASFPEGLSFCQKCLEAFRPDFAKRCRYCGMKLSDAAHPCGTRPEAFNFTHLGFDAVIPLGDYRGMLREATLRMKHRRYEGLSHEMGRFYAFYHGKTLRELRLDCVVPVPMHWLMRMSRRTSAAEVFAESLAKTLGIPMFPHLVRVNRLTRLQRSLKPEHRAANVAGCFSVRHPLPAWAELQKTELRHIFENRRILIVDDVITTGATCNELSRLLKTELGVNYVVVAVLAKARGRSLAQAEEAADDDW